MKQSGKNMHRKMHVNKKLKHAKIIRVYKLFDNTSGFHIIYFY